MNTTIDTSLDTTMDITEKELKYLGLLSKQFPNSASAASEIMNLQAILNLPKGTEHFLADIHGEYEAFIHVLKNASGTIRTKVESLFSGQIREQELRQLCTLIYYPAWLRTGLPLQIGTRSPSISSSKSCSG